MGSGHLSGCALCFYALLFCLFSLGDWMNGWMFGPLVFWAPGLAAWDVIRWDVIG